RLPGLDGLRALAIVAVLALHLDPSWLPGGFLGVDVFFVVSGFLITTLLLRERAATGSVDVRAFWARRARRLLPPLLVVLPVSVFLARLTEADLLVGVGRQVAGALTFTSNWVEIAAGSDYFAATSPQLFMNLWSLAVEEQFYLLWPLAVLVLMRVGTPLSRAGAVLGLGLASALLMAVLLDPASPTRVYYGTDTHLVGLMVGAATAFAYAGPQRAFTRTPWWGRHHRAVVLAALATLGALLWTADQSSALTFRGGIALASVATAALVLVTVSTPGPLRSALELPVCRWLGARSYGIYLWHWPVILIVGQDLDLAPGGPAYLWSRLWCLLVILALSDLTYRFVETPVRRRGFAGTAGHVLERLRRSGTRIARVVWGAVLVGTLVLAVVLVTAPERTSTEQLLSANEASLANDSTAPDAADAADPVVAASPTTKTSTAKPAASTAPAGSVAQDWSMPTGKEIDGFGDSMMVGAKGALAYYFPKIRMDARSNRRWTQAPDIVDGRSAVRRAVVLAFGTNWGTDEKAIARVLDDLGPDRMVVVVTVHGPFSRAKSDNAELTTLLAGRPNVTIADWDGALAGTSGQLQPDGIHPSRVGAHLYAKTVRAALARLSEQHTGQEVTLEELPIP
ncbi:MAG: acyltransferase family protein, partial [Ornithinibacter sp.]